MYNVYVSVLVSPSSSSMLLHFRDRSEWNYRRDLVFGERASSWIGWWSCALRKINQSAVWEHLALLYAACLTDSTDTWKPSERAQCKSHCCSTGPCIMQEALSLALSLCPLLCGKNRSTDLSVQLFFMLLTFTWISPGAAAVGSHLALLCLNVCVSVCEFKHACVCTHLWQCVYMHVCWSMCACQPGLDCCISLPLHSDFNKSGILVLQWCFLLLWWERGCNLITQHHRWHDVYLQ